MTARPGAGGGGGVLGLVLLSWGLALAAEPMPAEVRVRSTPAPLPTTTITVRAAPDTVVEDRTVGAKPAAEGQGMASSGDTFRDEIRVFLRGLVTSRPAAIEVSDDLVSIVRVVPEEAGTTVVVFVRQPLTYTITRPSAAGEIVIALKGRPVPPRRHARAEVPAPGGEDQVTVDAEELKYDQEHDVVVARGGVTITRGVVTLRADEVRYDRKSGIADANGNVVVTDPDTTLEGSVAHLNLNDESGWMEAANADFSRSGYSLVSRRLEKGIGPTYGVDDGIFSTCRCGGLEKPSWSVAGKRTDVRLNGIGVVRGATFRVRDIPVLWFPIFAFPTLTDRATGFLVPRVSYSSRRGFQYEQPFFWNISKSQDATVAVDVETAARVGLLGEYRYILSHTARGVLAGGYWNESFRSAGADEVLSSTTPTGQPPVNRWLALGRIIQPVGNGQAYMDAFAVSDDTLLREIHNFSSTLDTGLSTQSARLTKTRAGFIQTWNGGLAQGEAVYYQDLIDPQELAPQQAPNLRAEQSWSLLDNRMLGRLAGTVVNFQRNEGFDGFRGDVAPELFLPFNLGRAVHGSVTGRVHGTLYQLADDRQVALVVPDNPAIAQSFRVAQTQAGVPQLPLLDPSHFRAAPEVRGLLGTEVARVFDFPHLGLQKLRHSIEPTISYLYVPQIDQHLGQVAIDGSPCQPCLKTGKNGQCLVANPNYGVFCNATLYSRGYLFDELDAINRRSFFSYGLTTRLIGRFGGAVEPTPPVGADIDEEEEWGDTDAGAAQQKPAAEGTAGAGGEKPAPRPATPAAPTRELLRFTALHGFDSVRDINTNSHLANLDFGLRLTPIDYLAFTYEASMNVAGGALDAQSARIDLREPGWVPSPGNVYQSASMLTLSYRFVEQNVNLRGGTPADQRLFANSGNQNVIGGLYLRLGDYFGASFGALYDVNGGQVVNDNGRKRTLGPHFILRDFLFRVISPCNCWAAEFGVSDNFDTDETLFRFQITLLGLGSFGPGAPTSRYYGITTLPSLGIRAPAALGASGGYF